jgi:hypothetical protein
MLRNTLRLFGRVRIDLNGAKTRVNGEKACSRVGIPKFHDRNSFAALRAGSMDNWRLPATWSANAFAMTSISA